MKLMELKLQKNKKNTWKNMWIKVFLKIITQEKMSEVNHFIHKMDSNQLNKPKGPMLSVQLKNLTSKVQVIMHWITGQEWSNTIIFDLSTPVIRLFQIQVRLPLEWLKPMESKLKRWKYPKCSKTFQWTLVTKRGERRYRSK